MQFQFIKTIRRFLQRNKLRLWGIFCFIILATVYFFLHLPTVVVWVEKNLHLSNLSINYLVSIIIELTGPVILFILFGKEIIQRLTHYKFEEIDYFDENIYFNEIASAKKEIKILETYIERLLSKPEKLQDSLNRFIENSHRYGNVPKIRILLIDPYCEASKQRIIQLIKHYRDDLRYKHYVDEEEFVKAFRTKMHEWLDKLGLIHTFLTELHKSNLDFEIKIYDAVPPYSLYTYDNVGFWGFFRGGVPTTSSKQLKIYDLNSAAAEFFLNRFDEIYSSTYCNTISIRQYLKNPKGVQLNPVVSKFKQIISKSNIDEIYSTLCDIPPSQLKEDDFYALIDYIEQKYAQTEDYNFTHYNIFGSGGDKTINISSMSAILASYIDDISIVKVGTSQVTSQQGSQQFFQHLSKRATELKDEAPRFLQFNKNSAFVSLESLGYSYTPSFIAARKKLFEEKKLDLFKIVFPCANLTKSSGQVNGVHDTRYIEYYKKIAQKYNRNMLIVHSLSFEMDELMVGKNRVIHIHNGKVKEEVIDIPRKTMSREKYLAFFEESPYINNHVDKYIQILKNEIEEDILITLAYNIACIQKLHSPQMSINNLAKQTLSRLKDMLPPKSRIR